ncbi:MAG: hypothetical protein ACOX1P_17190 [Thermoguttaceae bacterium]
MRPLEVLVIVAETDGVAHTLVVPGFSLLTNANLPNMGGMFSSFRANQPQLFLDIDRDDSSG